VLNWTSEAQYSFSYILRIVNRRHRRYRPAAKSQDYRLPALVRAVGQSVGAVARRGGSDGHGRAAKGMGRAADGGRSCDSAMDISRGRC